MEGIFLNSGNYNGLKNETNEEIRSILKSMDRLEAEDNEYKGFCETIRVSARRFDDDSIINYLSQ